jgi:hypothetical protein
LPDNLFTSLICSLGELGSEKLIDRFKDIIEKYSAFDLILKLRLREKHFSDIESYKIATALATIGNLIPEEDDFHFATTYAQSASLIASLIRNFAKENQLKFTLEILTHAQSIDYAMEINYWIMYREKNNPNTSIFKDKDELIIQEHLISLVANNLNADNIFSILKDIELQRLLLWWKKSKKYKNKLNSIIKDGFKKNRTSFALNLIKVFTPTITATTLNTGTKSIFKSGFYKEQFDNLSKVVDVTILNKYLMPKFGSNPSDEDPSTISNREPISDEKLVSAFQWYKNNQFKSIS